MSEDPLVGRSALRTGSISGKGTMKKSIEFGPIRHHVAFQVHLTWRAIRKWLLADARTGEDKVSRGSYSVPILIGLNPGISPQELAEALNLDASKITLFLKSMEEDGYLTRTSSPSDRRRYELHLTESGQEHMKHALKMSRKIEARWSEVLTEQEVETLVRLLAKIRRRNAEDVD
jgi:DNA-binding MarR family transcriptional regulator